mmetsp:Transcript_19606/g.28792  ORF Transcript_19606/g.28792 Transcript_19606/m.28792 type:complete len:236 (-) Transcript_19606:595-1302(-)
MIEKLWNIVAGLNYVDSSCFGVFPKTRHIHILAKSAGFGWISPACGSVGASAPRHRPPVTPHMWRRHLSAILPHYPTRHGGAPRAKPSTISGLFMASTLTMRPLRPGLVPGSLVPFSVALLSIICFAISTLRLAPVRTKTGSWPLRGEIMAVPVCSMICWTTLPIGPTTSPTLSTPIVTWIVMVSCEDCHVPIAACSTLASIHALAASTQIGAPAMMNSGLPPRMGHVISVRVWC